MNYSYFKFFCFFFFFSSLVLGVSSKSGFFIWASFELGIMAFIPLAESFSCFMSVALMKYYIVQSMASVFFLFFVILKHVVFYDLCGSLEFFVFLMMWVKLGFFPFSAWYYQVSENMSWALWFLLNTFQKLLPLWVITLFMYNSFYIYVMLLINSVYSISEIFNQVSLRWMINSSSLNHFSWMIVSVISFMTSWELYFLIYLLSNFMLFSVMMKNNWAGVMSMMFPKSLGLMFLYMMVFFNFMGVPPFMGFMGKILILYSMSSFCFLIFLLSVTVGVSMVYMSYFLGALSNIMYCKFNNNLGNAALLVVLSSVMPLSLLIWVL